MRDQSVGICLERSQPRVLLPTGMLRDQFVGKSVLVKVDPQAPGVNARVVNFLDSTMGIQIRFGDGRTEWMTLGDTRITFTS